VADDLDALREALRDLLAKRSDARAASATRLGYDTGLWRTLCDMGVAGLAIPEQYGGADAGAPATAAAMIELGRTLTPSPLLGSAVLAGQLLLALGDGAACERLLPGIGSGEIVAALAWSGADGEWDAPPIRCVAGRLDGTAHYVLDGDTADVLLVVAADAAGVAVYEVDHAERQHTPTMDATRRLATVTCTGATGMRIGPPDALDALERARRAALVALAAEQAGAAAAALERTVAYAKVREQFGRPIGSFQALKHRLADVHVAVTAAQSIATAAAAGTVDAAVASFACGEALQSATAEMIQLHGGIAITWEHDAHLYFKRADASARLFGTSSRRLAGVARLAGITA
jgi:alkylation response protein AidB-like acyl-CoA dehydrogenase